MKAVICSRLDGTEALAVGELPDLQPGPGQVVIDVKAAALNFPDALMVRGMYQVKPPLPFSPGAELSGIVRAVGEGVQRPKVGDAVIALPGHGGCAAQCVVDAQRTMPLPEGIDFDTGAAFGLAYGTALHALRDVGQLQAGETLVVLGASGGTGVAAIACGKALGATVIACASSADKLALCKAQGADHLVDYSEGDLRAKLEAIAGKGGVNVVFDAVGGAYTEPALRATGWHGRLLVIGFAAGEIPKLPLNLALLSERKILGVYWGDWTRKDPAGHARNMKDLVGWIRDGTIKVPITGRVGLEGVAGAIARMADRRITGKVVVNP